MIVHTVRAVCDSCAEVVTLRSTSNQRFRDLTELGWTNQVEGDDILVFCPRHNDQAQQDPVITKVDRWTTEVWRRSQGDHVIIREAGVMQDLVTELRALVGLGDIDD